MNSEPVEKELTDEEFEDVLNNIYGDINICGMTFDSGYVLRELDPTAFRCGKIDYEDSLEPEEWVCGECGEIYYNEDEAEECCQPEEDKEDYEED